MTMISNDESIANGTPMDVEQMREYLQAYYRIPIVFEATGNNNYQMPVLSQVA